MNHSRVFAFLVIQGCATTVISIWCWEGTNGNKLEKMNCNEEFQREEMYCFNKTERFSNKFRSSGCHALQWFEDKVGCHTEEADEGTSLIQCVCSTDFCNGPHSTLDLIHISKSHKFIQNWFFIVAQ